MKALSWMSRGGRLFTKNSTAKAEPRRRIVVVEQTAASIEQVLGDGEFQEVFVVAESAEDVGPSLALRVAGRIAQLEQRRTPACSATLLLGQERGGQAAAARELVARSLLSHLKATGGDELTILASSSGDEEYDEVLGLVDRLLSELDTRSITIRTKFLGARRTRSPVSGIFPVPSADRKAS